MSLHLSIGHGKVVSVTLVNGAPEGKVVSATLVNGAPEGRVVSATLVNGRVVIANWCMEQQSGGCTKV